MKQEIWKCTAVFLHWYWNDSVQDPERSIGFQQGIIYGLCHTKQPT
jgi:hypothetical protein